MSVQVLLIIFNLDWLSVDIDFNNTFKSTNNTYEKDEQYIIYLKLLFTTESNNGWFYKSAIPTGWIVLVLMLAINCFTIPCVRHSILYEVAKFEIIF